MALDASIYNLLGRGVKSFNEYQDEDIGLQAKRLNLLGMKQAQEDDNALRAATKSFGTDEGVNRDLLAKTGNYKALSAFDKAALDGQKTRGEITKDAATAGHLTAQTGDIAIKQKIAAHDRHLAQLGTLTDPSQIDAWAAQGVQDGVLGMQASMQGAQQMKDFAAKYGFEAAKQQALRGGMSAKDQLEQQLKGKEYGLKNANEIMTQGPDGSFGVNQPLVAAKAHVAKSGASNVSVKVDNALGEGVAKQVGPMVESSYNAAQGAQASIANADSIIKAIDSGKVMAGPGAGVRMGIAQVADTLGLGGKDTKEKIAATRATIQGLNQSILTARSQLKGQGQVSDYEGKLLAKATAGDIDELTPPEIRQLATLNKRLSNQVIAQHGQLITKLKGHAPTQPIADLFETNPGNPAPVAAPQAAPAMGGFKYIGVAP